MIHHVRGMALGAYRRDVDPACPSDDAAEAAILEAARYAREVSAPRADGVRRLRAPRRAGAPWSRCYLVVGPTGDVIDVQPESPHGRSGAGRSGRGDRAAQLSRRFAVVVVADPATARVRLQVHRDELKPDEARQLAGRLLDCADRAEGQERPT